MLLPLLSLTFESLTDLENFNSINHNTRINKISCIFEISLSLKVLKKGREERLDLPAGARWFKF